MSVRSKQFLPAYVISARQIVLNTATHSLLLLYSVTTSAVLPLGIFTAPTFGTSIFELVLSLPLIPCFMSFD